MGQPGRATDANGDGVFEPWTFYAWNNTLHGARLNMVLRPWADPEKNAKHLAHVKAGRDFFHEETKPDCYKPFVDRHRLQSGREALMKSVADSPQLDEGFRRKPVAHPFAIGVKSDHFNHNYENTMFDRSKTVPAAGGDSPSESRCRTDKPKKPSTESTAMRQPRASG